MAKILLVEDDSNLREIYGARLEAEGYQIVAAGDGEEALATAVRELPDLIISDIMMPKISGFDMLDILRSTPETKDVKVIVMTALSQKEDKKRGEELGADRYVVKSQVTLDDIVTMVSELLGNQTQAAPVATPSASDSADNSIALDISSSDDAVSSDAQTASDTKLVQQTQVTQKTTPDSTITPVDAATLDQEVEQFVATSPLMNGTIPASDTQSSEDSPRPQPPIQTGTPTVG